MQSTPGDCGSDLLAILYGDRQTSEVWSSHETVATWLRVEAELAQSQAELQLIPQGYADAIAAVCRIDRIAIGPLWERARIVGYPILPLIEQIAASLPDAVAGYVHFGATTQDIMDTALSIQLQRTYERLIVLTLNFGDSLSRLTSAHAETVMAARTHAQQAVPTTFGAKCAVFLAEVGSALERLEWMQRIVPVVSLFGAAGTNAAMGRLSSSVRSALARRLGLLDAVVPWHVARDRVAETGATLSLLATVCVRFAREVVQLSRTEVGEVREGGHRATAWRIFDNAAQGKSDRFGECYSVRSRGRQ